MKRMIWREMRRHVLPLILMAAIIFAGIILAHRAPASPVYRLLPSQM